MNATHRGPKASTEVSTEQKQPLYYFRDSSNKYWGFSLGHPFDPWGFIIGDRAFDSLEEMQADYAERTGIPAPLWVRLVIQAPER
jgi:hypothetical protein